MLEKNGPAVVAVGAAVEAMVVGPTPEPELGTAVVAGALPRNLSV